MKKITVLFALFAFISLHSFGQNMNTIATEAAKILPNGWHQFQLRGVVYDVEIADRLFVKGNVKWLDGNTYSGSLGSKGISGRGTYTWSNGERYEGSVRNNQRHGKGTMYWKDGTKFSGKWRENKQHGKGKLFDVNGVVVKSGTWEMGKFVDKNN